MTLAATTTSYKRTGLNNETTYDWNVQALGDGVDYVDCEYDENNGNGDIDEFSGNAAEIAVHKRENEIVENNGTQAPVD